MNVSDRNLVVDTLIRADSDKRTCPICGDTSDRCTFERACSCWYGRSCKRVLRCTARHPSHPRQVRCEEARGHSGEHFHSFYMRSWSDDPYCVDCGHHHFYDCARSCDACLIDGRTAGNREAI